PQNSRCAHSPAPAGLLAPLSSDSHTPGPMHADRQRICSHSRVGGEEPAVKVRAALSCAVAPPAGAGLLAVDASHLQPQPDDLCDVDRKQHGAKEKHGIKLSCDAVEDE